MLKSVKAIGFDLFDTLITIRGDGIGQSLNRLCVSLQEQGIAYDEVRFREQYVRIARRLFREAQQSGIETHNREWISTTFAAMQQPLPADDPRLSRALQAYFDSFTDFAELVPGTAEMLTQLAGRYRLALLSNFTDGPGARAVLRQVGLDGCFDAILISGELGYRKPHPEVFRQLQDVLDAPAAQIVFVGDNVEDDISGAGRAGMQPVWMRYAHESGKTHQHQIMSHPEHAADEAVPQISCWEDLFLLLEP